MSRIIGQAADFYRLRLTRIEEPTGVDFEWRDDILYREPPPADLGSDEQWIVEAVELDDEETTRIVGAYPSRDEAEDVLKSAQDDLGEMTRSQFEERHLCGP